MQRYVLCLFVLSVSADANAGPVSKLYLANGDDDPRIWVVQGDSVVRSWTTSNTEFCLAVAETVRTLQLNSLQGPPGREYTLKGIPTGVVYPAPPFAQYNSFFDGTTDGTYNYAVGPNMVTVVRFDSNWQNPSNIFELPHIGGYIGITYDPSNNSLWISPWGGQKTVRNWSMDGTLLSEFAIETDLTAALALDPADDTLWMMDRRADSPYGRYLQYSKSGELLSVQYYSGLGNTLGGEFQRVAPGDITPPTLSLPFEVVKDAVTPNGSSVEFSVTATDDVDPDPDVFCTPPSGSFFAIGTTIVSCTAMDSSVNVSSGTFTVRVRGAAQQIVELMAMVNGFNLKQGIINSLDAKLQNAEAALSAAKGGNRSNVCNLMSAFISETDAQSGKLLTAGEGTLLIVSANQIRAVLACP